MIDGKSFMVILAACATAAANLLLRHGVIAAGGISLMDSRALLQLAQLFGQPTFLLGFILYGVAAIIWFSVLSTVSLTIAYPILVALSFLLIISGGVLFFQEELSGIKVLGSLIICLGIYLVGR